LAAVKTYPLFINGEFVAPEAPATLDVLNPATAEVIARVPDASAADVDRAVKAARTAFDEGPWKDATAQDRGRILLKLANIVRDRAAELAELETRNTGKPIVEAEFDIADVATCFEYYGGLATKITGEVNPVPDKNGNHSDAGWRFRKYSPKLSSVIESLCRCATTIWFCSACTVVLP